MKILISEVKAGVKETKLRRKDGDISELKGTTHVYVCKLGFPNPLACPWLKLMFVPEHKIPETTDSKGVKKAV